jgi:hypothetical protein
VRIFYFIKNKGDSRFAGDCHLAVARLKAGDQRDADRQQNKQQLERK